MDYHRIAMTNDAHATPSGDAPPPLYDTNVATPTHAERARTMVAALTTGTLSTIAIDPPGFPYGSFTTLGFIEGDPVFLISELAEHTKNLRADPRASALVAEGGADDPLANGRVTLLGHCQPTEDQRVREAYLAAHPNAAYYVDFKDFNFWRLTVSKVRYIGGYGRMSWVPVDQWHDARPDPIGTVAAGIVEHMNKDHADAMPLYCRAFSKAEDTEVATMTGIDRYGFEMSAQTDQGPRPVRLAFPEPIQNATQAREALVAMLKDARATLGVTR